MPARDGERRNFSSAQDLFTQSTRVGGVTAERDVRRRRKRRKVDLLVPASSDQSRQQFEIDLRELREERFSRRRSERVRVTQHVRLTLRREGVGDIRFGLRKHEVLSERARWRA